MRVFITSLVLGAFLLSSCATILQGTKKKVSIRSLTPNTKIYVNGEYKGKDLVTVKLKRKDEHTVLATKKGYEKQVKTIDNHIQAGWLVADIIFGFGWVGLAVDFITGALYAPDTKSVTS